MREIPKITITDPLTVEIYLCYLIEQLGEITSEQLSSIIMEHEFISYFDYMSGMIEARKKNLISQKDENGENHVYLLENGKILAREFSNRIPLSIREKSIAYGKEVLKTAELERAVVCRIERGMFESDPCYLTVKFKNEMGGMDLMDLKVYSPDYEQAKKMRERFLERPSEIIADIMNMFIKDKY